MQKFYEFKDPQYGTLLNPLNNYIPLLLSIYSISFKLNHFSEYFCAIIRIWIMFACLQRRHYNKARARKIFEFHLARWASNSQLLLVQGTYPLAQVFKLINNS